MTTVLVTRPEPGASSTVQRLRELGFNAVKLPLTQIVALAHEIPAGPFDGVIITSAQALLGLDAKLITQPLYAVGETSAAAAAQAGFVTVHDGGGDVAALADTIRTAMPLGSRLLYLCGIVRRPDLERALAGYALSVVETYDAKVIDYAAVDLPELDLVLLTSVQSVGQISKLLARPALNSTFANASYLCLSQRIADALIGVRPTDIHVCARPDEDSLLNLAAILGEIKPVL